MNPHKLKCCCMRIKWCMFLPRWDRQLKFMYAQNQGVERGWKNFTLFDWYDMMQRYFHYLRKREVCSILGMFHYPKQASDIFLQSEWEGTCLIDVCSKCQHRGAISYLLDGRTDGSTRMVAVERSVLPERSER